MAKSKSPPALISTEADLKAFLSSISSASVLYLDLEGDNISRNGAINIITILLYPQKIVRLIDVMTLKELAFTVAADNGRTLKSVFESPKIPKYLWDVRNDADALWALYQVGLAGVTDIQLLEIATRFGQRTLLAGLDKAVRSSLKLGGDTLKAFLQAKKDMRKKMSTGVFSARPLEDATIQYCANDVLHLPALKAVYMQRIFPKILARVMRESAARVVEAQDPGYDPHGPTRKFGPWGSGAKERARVLTG